MQAAATNSAPVMALGGTELNVLAKLNYKFYVRYVNEEYKHGKHTELVCKKLQEIEAKHAAGIPTFTIFTMPPRHSKSMTISETFPTWFIGKNKRRRVILASYGAELARKFGLANLQKIEGKAGRIFEMELDNRQNAATNFNIKDHKGGMVSTGFGGALTGMGADLLIIDDPIRNRQDANSPAYREKIWNEWKATLSTRLQPGGSVIIILTRWHEDDLVGRILENDPREWDQVNLPAVAEENDLLGREPGATLWPEYGFNKEWAASKEKEVGPLEWASLYQQHPRPAAGTLFKRGYFKYYKALPPLREFEQIIQSWDCTFKDLETSDYVAGGVWGKKGADFYLLYRVKQKMGIVATMDAIKSVSAAWPQAYGIYIEDKANGSAVIEMLKNQISGINAVNPNGGKLVRAQAVLPLIAAGNVWLPDPAIDPSIEEYISEMTAFPYGKHDDEVDQTTQALSILQTAPGLQIGRA